MQTQNQKLLTDLQNCISTYLDQLSAEKDILLAGNANDLNEITNQKQATINHLSDLENQATPLLDSLKKQAQDGGDDSATQEWQTLSQLLHECQEKTAENSALVNTRLKHTTNTLHQLYSLFNTNQSITYNEDGSEKYISEPNKSVHA